MAVQWHYIIKLINDTVPNHILQPITKLYLFTIELKLRDDFRCFRVKMCFRTFSTVPLNSPIAVPLKGRPTSGSARETSIVDEPRTELSADMLFSLSRLSVVSQCTRHVMTNELNLSINSLQPGTRPWLYPCGL